jgi:hypothetical protein
MSNDRVEAFPDNIQVLIKWIAHIKSLSNRAAHALTFTEFDPSASDRDELRGMLAELDVDLNGSRATIKRLEERLTKTVNALKQAMEKIKEEDDKDFENAQIRLIAVEKEIEEFSKEVVMFRELMQRVPNLEEFLRKAQEGLEAAQLEREEICEKYPILGGDHTPESSKQGGVGQAPTTESTPVRIDENKDGKAPTTESTPVRSDENKDGKAPTTESTPVRRKENKGKASTTESTPVRRKKNKGKASMAKPETKPKPNSTKANHVPQVVGDETDEETEVTVHNPIPGVNVHEVGKNARKKPSKSEASGSSLKESIAVDSESETDTPNKHPDPSAASGDEASLKKNTNRLLTTWVREAKTFLFKTDEKAQCAFCKDMLKLVPEREGTIRVTHSARKVNLERLMHKRMKKVGEDLSTKGNAYFFENCLKSCFPNSDTKAVGTFVHSVFKYILSEKSKADERKAARKDPHDLGTDADTEEYAMKASGTSKMDTEDPAPKPVADSASGTSKMDTEASAPKPVADSASGTSKMDTEASTKKRKRSGSYPAEAKSKKSRKAEDVLSSVEESSSESSSGSDDGSIPSEVEEEDEDDSKSGSSSESGSSSDDESDTDSTKPSDD